MECKLHRWEASDSVRLLSPQCLGSGCYLGQLGWTASLLPPENWEIEVNRLSQPSWSHQLNLNTPQTPAAGPLLPPHTVRCSSLMDPRCPCQSKGSHLPSQAISCFYTFTITLRSAQNVHSHPGHLAFPLILGKKGHQLKMHPLAKGRDCEDKDILHLENFRFQSFQTMQKI